MSRYRKAYEDVRSDPRCVSNLDWGEAREGHPEGSVRSHIAELDENLEALKPKLAEEEYWKLKLLIHTHDTFKGEAQARVAIADPASHASLARDFLATHCDDADLLAMVQYHDEPFALYRQFEARGKYNADRFRALMSSIRDWNLFLAFNLIDGCTAGKSRDALRWLFREVGGKVESQFTEADILG
jgi:hypothetical protein